MTYEPGDIANGHILGADGVWRPGVQAAAEPQGDMAAPRFGYWKRYGRRWTKTGVIMGALTGLAPLMLHLSEPQAHPNAPVLLDYALGVIIGFSFWGTLLNFIVAVFPARNGQTRIDSLSKSVQSIEADGAGKSRRVMVWISAIVAVCVVGFVGVLAAAHDADPSSDSPSGVVGSSDSALMEEMGTHSSAWNETLAPVVAHYLDPNVDAEAWVVEAGPVLSELEPMIRAMGNIAAGISDADLRGQVMTLIGSYQDKFKAFSKLVNAVLAEDPDAEQAAQTELNAASQEGTRLAEEMMVSFDD